MIIETVMIVDASPVKMIGIVLVEALAINRAMSMGALLAKMGEAADTRVAREGMKTSAPVVIDMMMIVEIPALAIHGTRVRAAGLVTHKAILRPLAVVGRGVAKTRTTIRAARALLRIAPIVAAAPANILGIKVRVAGLATLKGIQKHRVVDGKGAVMIAMTTAAIRVHTRARMSAAMQHNEGTTSVAAAENPILEAMMAEVGMVTDSVIPKPRDGVGTAAMMTVIAPTGSVASIPPQANGRRAVMAHSRYDRDEEEYFSRDTDRRGERDDRSQYSERGYGNQDLYQKRREFDEPRGRNYDYSEGPDGRDSSGYYGDSPRDRREFSERSGEYARAQQWDQPSRDQQFPPSYSQTRHPSRGDMGYGGIVTQGSAQGAFKGKGPKDYKRSDERLKEDVCDRLTDDEHLDASDISVAVSSGEVTLEGTVSSREAKRIAEVCAEQCSGVSHVQNNLRVGSPKHGSATEQNAAGTRSASSSGKSNS